MKIGFANDHSAIDMKAELIPWLEAQGYEVVNFGTDSRESTDYAVWGEKQGSNVSLLDSIRNFFNRIKAFFQRIFSVFQK